MVGRMGDWMTAATTNGDGGGYNADSRRWRGLSSDLDKF
jgi:hypothetical protein